MSASAKVRTTVTFDRDVATEIERIRREKDVGLSEAINDLVRAGLLREAGPAPEPFEQETHDFGAFKVDLRNIGEALEELEGPSYR